MNLLFLSNPARNYYKFFNPLAKEFEKDGHSVCFAVDCNYSYYTNYLEEERFRVYSFEDYFSNHVFDPEILDQYSDFNLSEMLLADFERGQYFGFWRKLDVSYSDRLKSALISFFKEVIERESIDAIVYENVAGAFAYFSLAVCKKIGCRYIGITSSRLPNRFSITEDPMLEYIPFQDKTREILDGRLSPSDSVVDWSLNYLKNLDNIEPDYMSFNKLDSLALTSDLRWREKSRIWFGAFKFRPDDPMNSFGLGDPLCQRMAIMRRTIFRMMRVPRLKKYYSKAICSEKYLLYPLHYHPEASTSVLSGAYLDEYEVIRNIAFNLPEGVKLYVKDHRSAYGFQNLDFYRKVSLLPSTRIIDPFSNTKDLIRKSLAVITLTSTVGYEALLLRKRVFLYGNVFYQFHPDIVRVENPAKLFQLLKEWLDKPLQADERYNLCFLQAYFLSTYPGLLNVGAKGSDDLAVRLFPQIKEIIELKTGCV